MLDDTDRMILRLLTEDSRIQYAELGKKVHLSAPAVHSRVKKLEQSGVISHYTVAIRPEAIDKHVCAFVRIMLGSTPCEETAKRLHDFPEIQECHTTAGEDCILIKVRVTTPTMLDHLLQRMRRIPGIQRTVTTVVLNSHFERGVAPEIQAS